MLTVPQAGAIEISVKEVTPCFGAEKRHPAGSFDLHKSSGQCPPLL